MRINFKVIIALVIAVGILVLAFNALQVQTYSGAELTFTMSGGPVSIENPSATGGTALLTTSGTSGTFAIRGSHLNTAQTSTREGSGRTAVNSISVPLEPGTTEIQLTRGSNVQATLTGSEPFTVTAAPMSENSARDTLLFAVVVAAAALGYAAYQSRGTFQKLLNRSGRATVTEAELHAYNQ